jgi:hypothetical protein
MNEGILPKQEAIVKRITCAVLLTVVMATPAFAAKVYLKEGGVIQAKRVWREGGKVHVLATRHTLTTFEPSEVDLKRTFVKRHRATKKVAAVSPQAPVPVKGAAPLAGAPAAPKPAENKVGITLPKMPKLPEKTPDSLVPSSGGGGTIKQHKKEMAEKTAD